MKKIIAQYAMRKEKYNELEKSFTPNEIDVFMAELGKIRNKTIKRIKKYGKSN